MFNPKPQYEVVQDALPIRDFKDYWEEFVVRPPYFSERVRRRERSRHSWTVRFAVTTSLES